MICILIFKEVNMDKNMTMCWDIERAEGLTFKGKDSSGGARTLGHSNAKGNTINGTARRKRLEAAGGLDTYTLAIAVVGL